MANQIRNENDGRMANGMINTGDRSEFARGSNEPPRRTDERERMEQERRAEPVYPEPGRGGLAERFYNRTFGARGAYEHDERRRGEADWNERDAAQYRGAAEAYPRYRRGEGPGAMPEPGDTRDRGAQSYGDYGHPGTDEHRAYGDMGAGPRGPLAVERAREGSSRTADTAFGGATQQREPRRGARRWRRGMVAAGDVMTRNPRTVRPGEPVARVGQLMVDEDTGIIPVVDEGNRLLGVVTDRDIVARLVARNIDMRNARAADAMTDDVQCATEQSSLRAVLRIMGEHQVRRVPVIARGDRLVGIISMSDIAREADFDDELQSAFEEISTSRGFWSRLR